MSSRSLRVTVVSCSPSSTKHNRSLTFNAYCTFTLLCLYVTLPSTSIEIFKTFLPDHRPLGPNGELYLRADYSVCTSSPEYVQLLRPIAIIAVVVYPVGVNLLYSVLLWRHRNEIQMEALKDKTSRGTTPISFLYQPFTREFFWWEAVDSVGLMTARQRPTP